MSDASAGIIIGAGEWTIESDRPDLARMELNLDATGRVEGTHRALDLSGRTLGELQFDAGRAELTLKLLSAFGLRPSELDLELHLTGQSGDTITAEDAPGSETHYQYRLRRQK